MLNSPRWIVIIGFVITVKIDLKAFADDQSEKALLRQQACSEVEEIGADIDKFPVAKCFKEPVLKDYDEIESICKQRNFDNVDVVERTEELDQKWKKFKEVEITKPYTPEPVAIKTCVPTKTDLEKTTVNYFVSVLDEPNSEFMKRILIENIANSGLNITYINGIYEAFEKFVKLVRSDKVDERDLEDAYKDVMAYVDKRQSSQKGYENFLNDEDKRKNPIYAESYKYFNDFFSKLHRVVEDRSLAKEFFNEETGIMLANWFQEMLRVQKILGLN